MMSNPHCNVAPLLTVTQSAATFRETERVMSSIFLPVKTMTVVQTSMFNVGLFVPLYQAYQVTWFVVMSFSTMLVLITISLLLLHPWLTCCFDNCRGKKLAVFVIL